jgi:hypothetical protein
MNRNLQDKTTPKPPPSFSFVTITNPNESKTRSKKRAVRSHVAYYQHHKDDDKPDVPTPHRKSSKRVIKDEDFRSSTTPSLSSESSSDSINFRQLGATSSQSSPRLSSESSPYSINFDFLAASEFDAHGSGYGSRALRSGTGYGSPPLRSSFSGTRIDPFQSYPVPWKQFYDPILDFCKFGSARGDWSFRRQNRVLGTLVANMSQTLPTF